MDEQSLNSHRADNEKKSLLQEEIQQNTTEKILNQKQIINNLQSNENILQNKNNFINNLKQTENISSKDLIEVQKDLKQKQINKLSQQEINNTHLQAKPEKNQNSDSDFDDVPLENSLKQNFSIKQIIQSTAKKSTDVLSETEIKKKLDLPTHKQHRLSKIFLQVRGIQQLQKKVRQIAQENIRTRNLKLQHYQIIQDVAVGQLYMTNKISLWQVKFKKILVKMLSFLPIIQPSKKPKILIDLIFSIFIIIRMFYQTIQLTFCIFEVRECTELISNDVIIIMLISFFIQTIFELNTGYFDKGLIVTDRHLIVKNYFKNQFLLNLLAAIPLFYNLFVNKFSDDTYIYIGYILEFLVFFQIFGLIDLFKRLERVLTINETIANCFPLFKLILKILISAHLVGILFHFVGLIENKLDIDNNWLQTQGFVDKSLLQTYLFSFYWSCCTMVTILIFVPETQIEIIFSIFAIMVTCGLFGYALNTIGIILDEIYKKKRVIKQEKSQVTRFLYQKHITQNLKEKVQSYFDFLHRQEINDSKVNDNQVMQRLSPDLQKQIQRQIYKHIVGKFSMIKNNFSEFTLQNTLEIIEETFEHSGSLIYQENEHEEIYLYLLKKGKINIYITKDNKNKEQVPIRVVQPGQQFGQIQFFSGMHRQQSAKAMEPCTLLKISRSKFIELIKKTDEDFQIFSQIQDQLKLNQSVEFSQKIGLYNCEICQKNDHYTQKCSQVAYLPNTEKLIYQFNKLTEQIRRPFERRFHRYPSLWSEDETQLGFQELYENDFTRNQLNVYSNFLQQYSQYYVVNLEDNPQKVSYNNIKNIQPEGDNNLEQLNLSNKQSPKQTPKLKKHSNSPNNKERNQTEKHLSQISNNSHKKSNFSNLISEFNVNTDKKQEKDIQTLPLLQGRKKVSSQKEKLIQDYFKALDQDQSNSNNSSLNTSSSISSSSDEDYKNTNEKQSLNQNQASYLSQKKQNLNQQINKIIEQDQEEEEDDCNIDNINEQNPEQIILTDRIQNYDTQNIQQQKPNFQNKKQSIDLPTIQLDIIQFQEKKSQSQNHKNSPVSPVSSSTSSIKLQLSKTVSKKSPNKQRRVSFSTMNLNEFQKNKRFSQKNFNNDTLQLPGRLSKIRRSSIQALSPGGTTVLQTIKERRRSSFQHPDIIKRIPNRDFNILNHKNQEQKKEIEEIIIYKQKRVPKKQNRRLIDILKNNKAQIFVDQQTFHNQDKTDQRTGFLDNISMMSFNTRMNMTPTISPQTTSNFKNYNSQKSLGGVSRQQTNNQQDYNILPDFQKDMFILQMFEQYEWDLQVFGIMKLFSHYFVHNNYTEVILNYNQKTEKQRNKILDSIRKQINKEIHQGTLIKKNLDTIKNKKNKRALNQKQSLIIKQSENKYQRLNMQTSSNAVLTSTIQRDKQVNLNTLQMAKSSKQLTNDKFHNFNYDSKKDLQDS